MAPETGQITGNPAVIEQLLKEGEMVIKFDNRILTKKQRATKQISLKDYTSKAGQLRRKAAKTGRNEPCPCGSGVKFKKCCLISTGEDNE